MNNVAAALTAVMNSTAISRAEEQSLITRSSPAKRFITDCDDEDGLADVRNKTKKAHTQRARSLITALGLGVTTGSVDTREL